MHEQEGKSEEDYFAELVNNYQNANTEELIINISKYIALYIKENEYASDFDDWSCIDEMKFDMFIQSDKCCSLYTFLGMATGGLGFLFCCYNYKHLADKYRFPEIYDYESTERKRAAIVKEHWKYLRFWDMANLCGIFGISCKYRISTRTVGLVDSSEGYDRFMISTIVDNLERIKCTVYNILKYEDSVDVAI